MREMILALMMLAVFAFGFFVLDRFGQFLRQSERVRKGPRITDWTAYITDEDEDGGEDAYGADVRER